MNTPSRPAPLSPTATQVPPTKILVAVHGIGDQIGYATVQSVASQVGAYYDIVSSIPLGRFYPTAGAESGKPLPALMVLPQDPPQFRGIGFAEVYWAEIPRKIVEAGHILEETKRWARTVSGRLALRASMQGAPIPPREQVRLTTVLDEMIETVAVLERLNFVLAKAGLLKFSLNELLTDFLGDVQIVVDFQAYRDQILASFATVMEEALALSPGGPIELYIVAHSEGTVLTFMALLAALSNPDSHPWIRSIRGVMTIGSPIEPHHLLWPELWQHLEPHASLIDAPLGIPWHNYYDYGDPIAYRLDATKAWLGKVGFDRHLRLAETAFGRSYLPGKAHVDYWQDNELFAHFIETMVRPSQPSPHPAPAREPGSKWSAVIVSYAVPHLIIAALLCAGTYFLYRPVAGALNAQLKPLVVLGDVLGIGLLLLGITAATRIPRLTSKWRWWVVAAVLLTASMAGYQALVVGSSRANLGMAFIERAHRASLLKGEMPTDADVERATRGVQIVAGAIALLCGVLASWWPERGARFLPVVGLAATVYLIAELLWSNREGMQMWPIVLGGAIFFYLWWVATLLFDLVFIWHRYIRHAAALDSIAEITNKGYVRSKLEAEIDRRRSAKRRQAPAQ
jgi:hypothetical protein